MAHEFEGLNTVRIGDVALAYDELMPRWEYVEVPRASHIMHEDNPDAVNGAILGFLARHAPPERS